MTRTVAREIAIQLSFAAQLAGDDARETADTFFSREYFATLAEEDPLFQEYPDEKQLDYIRRLTGLVYDHMYELNHMIEKYARGWRRSAFPASLRRSCAAPCARFCIWTTCRTPPRSTRRWSWQGLRGAGDGRVYQWRARQLRARRGRAGSRRGASNCRGTGCRAQTGARERRRRLTWRVHPLP